MAFAWRRRSDEVDEQQSGVGGEHRSFPARSLDQKRLVLRGGYTQYLSSEIGAVQGNWLFRRLVEMSLEGKLVCVVHVRTPNVFTLDRYRLGRF